MTKQQRFEPEKLDEGFHKLYLSISKVNAGKTLSFPFFVIKSKKKGPIITFTSLMHGDELNGLGVSQKIIKNISKGILSGTVIIVPIFNYPGFIKRKRNFGKVDLNHIMPGKIDGSVQEKYVHKIFSEIILKSDYLIDMHSSRKDSKNVYHIRANLKNKEVKKTALLLNSDVIINQEPPAKTLRGVAEKEKIVSLTLEIGNSIVFQREYINMAYEGIENFLAEKKIIKIKKKKLDKKPIICNNFYRISVDNPGIVKMKVGLLDKVKKGQEIGELVDYFGETIEKIIAPVGGIVISKLSDPLIKEGKRVILIGKKISKE